MSIFEVLQSTGLPCAYSHFEKAQKPPYILYVGDGQSVLSADNTYYWRQNTYQIEYYYKIKDEAAETAIEDALLSAGYQYDKSGDSYIKDEDVFVIFYNV